MSNEVTITKLTTPDFDVISASFEADLIEYFQIIEGEIGNIIIKAQKEGMTEDELINAIENLFGE